MVLRGQFGKIASLVRLNEESGGALDYDCMTQLGVRLRNLPYRFGWDALELLVEHAPMDSAFKRWRNKDEAEFATSLRQSAMMADIFDAIQHQSYIIAKLFSKTAPREPKPYPRPWVEEKHEQRIGSAPIALGDFKSWYYETKEA